MINLLIGPFNFEKIARIKSVHELVVRLDVRVLEKDGLKLGEHQLLLAVLKGEELKRVLRIANVQLVRCRALRPRFALRIRDRG